MSEQKEDEAGQPNVGLLVVIVVMAFVGWFGWAELTMQRDYWKARFCEETTKTLSFCDEILNPEG